MTGSSLVYMNGRLPVQLLVPGPVGRRVDNFYPADMNPYSVDKIRAFANRVINFNWTKSKFCHLFAGKVTHSSYDWALFYINTSRFVPKNKLNTGKAVYLLGFCKSLFYFFLKKVQCASFSCSNPVYRLPSLPLSRSFSLSF